MECDIVICHFGPIFVLLPHYWQRKPKFGKNVKNACRYYPFTHDDHMMYGFWDMKRDGHNFWTVFFLSFRAIFVLWPSQRPKKSKSKILKKTPRDIIILHLRTTNYDHMMYGSWDIERDRENFLWFWAIFGPFTPLTIRKIKILKKLKKTPDILSFYTCVP